MRTKYRSKNGIPNFVMKKNPSVGKYDANGDGVADPDGDGTGMGWFPGYAIDVESGRRLNLFLEKILSFRLMADLIAIA